MKAITIELPDTIDAEAEEIKLLLASKLYEIGKLSLGQAAELAGLSKRSFAEMLGKYGVSLFNYESSEFLTDIKNA